MALLESVETAVSNMLLRISLIAALSFGATAASAQGRFGAFDNAIDTIASGLDFILPDDIPVKDLSLRLGIATGISPDYVGSDNYRVRVLPIVDLRYKDIVFLQGTKLKINVLNKDRFRVGPVISYRSGRSENRNTVLMGLGDVPDTFEIGGFAEFYLSGMRLTGDFRQAVSDNLGWNARATLSHGVFNSEKILVGVGVGFKWASNNQMDADFGITPAQSAASGIPIFDAGGGPVNISLSGLARYRLSEHWRVDGLLSVRRLLDGAARSPLTDTFGSKLQLVTGIGVRYGF